MAGLVVHSGRGAWMTSYQDDAFVRSVYSRTLVFPEILEPIR